MKRSFQLAALLLLLPPALSYSQGVRRDGVAFGQSGRPQPGAQIAVCTQPATTTHLVAGVYVPLLPCSPLATLYTDSTLSTACTGSNGCSNPLSADGNGNYHLYYSPTSGPFTFQYYGSGVTPYIQVDQQISTPPVITPPLNLSSGAADLLRLSGAQNPTLRLLTNSANASARNFAIAVNQLALGDFGIYQSTTNVADPISSGVAAFYISSLGNISFPGNLFTLTGSISSKGIANVVTFGADPTDTADSSAAFAAACAANSATVGGAVIVPQGTYKFTSVVSCPPGTRFIGQGTAGGGPGTGAPNLSTVYLDCYTANLVPFQVGTLGTASYLGVEFDNVTFRDPNGNCGGGLFVPNVSYAVLNNVGFQGFARGATVAPTTPALTPATTGGSLSAATYYVAISDNDPTEHETLTGTAVSSIVGGTIHGSIALASHTPTSPETCFNVYLGLSASTLHLVAHCQAAGPYTITATATGNVYPPSFDKSPGYGATFVGGSGGVGLASSYSNQVYINNPQVSLGTVNGIIADTNVSETFISGGNFNLAANTLGCGIIAGYAHIVTHTEAGGVGSKRICIDGSGGFLDVGLDLLNLSGLTGIAAVGAYGWQISGAASCSNGATLISYTSSSSINVSGLRDNGTCGISPAVASGFNTGSVTLANGPSSFIVTVGTGGAGSTGVITLPGIAPFGWFCQATNTTRAATVSQTANSATSCTLTNYGTTYSATNWTNSDVIFVTAAPF